MEIEFLKEAFGEALQAVGVSMPNPAVGAVVVQDGSVVGRGHTQKVGSPHAEVMALKMAGELARGATLYVTLEPCCHYGRTPPCTDAVIAAGISRVFFAHRDPNPQVLGKSERVLAAAGIASVCVPAPEEFLNFYEAYDFFVQNGTPFVECKLAEMSDGFIAHSNRMPLKISGAESDKWVAGWRRTAECILVGGGTAEMDNPRLTVRGVPGNNPRRIVFCGSHPLSPDLRLFEGPSKALVYSRIPRPELQSVAEVRLLPSADFAENWRWLLDDLARLGVHRLAVETGASLVQNLLKSGLWNRLYLIRSPNSLHTGLPWRTGVEPEMHRVKRLGRDSLWTALRSEVSK